MIVFWIAAQSDEARVITCYCSAAYVTLRAKNRIVFCVNTPLSSKR